MANHKSAIKRHRQSETKRIRNAGVKSSIKTAEKRVRESVAGGKADEALEGLKTAVRLLDRAVTKGVLHRNNASRRISRLTAEVNSTGSK